MTTRFAILSTLILSMFCVHAQEEAASPHTIILEIQDAQQINKETGKTEHIPVTLKTLERSEANIMARLYKACKQKTFKAESTVLDNQIRIFIPSITKKTAQEIFTQITRQQSLTIHKRHPKHSPALAEKVYKGEQQIQGATAYPQETRDKDGKIIATQYILIEKNAPVTGKDIERAQPNYATNTEVLITLTDAGTKKMEKFTRSLTPGRSFIVTILDGKVMNHAILNSEVLSKHFVISGLDDIKECERLSAALNNPLENEVEIISITPAK